MTDEQKKNYVKSTIFTGNSKRITEVLNRYFKSVVPPKNLKKSETKSDIIEFAEKIFS